MPSPSIAERSQANADQASRLRSLWAANRRCHECELSARCRGAVPGTGNHLARVVLVGEAPGQREDETAKPFQGAAGQYLNQLLAQTGLVREDFWITNVVKCRPSDANDTPSAKYVDVCAPLWLHDELDILHPDIVVAMGATAIKHFLGDVLVEDVHGLPFTPEETGLPYTVFATYHPAAVLNNPKTIGDTEYDFRMLAAYLNGEEVRVVDEIGDAAFYAWINDASRPPLLKDARARELLHDMRALGGLIDDPTVWERHDTISVDYELNPPYREYGMFCFSMCLEPGVAFAFAPTEANLRMLRAICADERLTKVYQNLIGVDFQTQRRYGIKVNRYVDTMVGAYELNWRPQGLKPLAMRRLGMFMKEYSEIAAAARRSKALEYLRAVVKWPEEWPNPEPITELKWDKKRGRVVEHTKRPQNIRRKAQYRIDQADKLGDEYDPWKKWYELEDEERTIVEEVLGPMPDAGLGEVAELGGEDAWAEVIWYSARDADATLRLWMLEAKALARDDLVRTLELDLPTLPLAVEIMDNGMRVNPDYMRSLSAEWKPRLDTLLDDLEREAGYRFNPNSPTQVAAVVYNPPTVHGRCTCGHFDAFHNAVRERKVGRGKKATVEQVEGACAMDCPCMAFDQEHGGLGMPLIKRKPSTEADVLKELAKRSGHPVLTGIIAYRHLSKLDGTYARKLPKLLDRNNRVHAAVKVTRTETGRWASGRQEDDDPIWNSQNIPIRDAESLRIRNGFEATPGWVLVEVDLSQIEMRVAAWLSNDRAMIEAFTSGHDFHTATAAKVANIPIEELEAALEAEETSEEHIWAAGLRRLAKVVNFGIIYGLTPEGLAEGTGLSLREAEAFINAYFKAYRGLELWLRQQEAFVKNYGYVESPLSGRRRYIPEVQHPFPWVVEAGVRQARNMPVQGMAQDILKLAEGKLLGMFEEWGVRDQVRVVNQIHDSLILELRIETWRMIAEGVKWLMEEEGSAVLTPLPVKADIKAGWRWGEMIEMKGAQAEERFERLMAEREHLQAAA